MASRREYQSELSQKANAPEQTEANGEKPIAIDGFQQVVDMLMAADPAFRESFALRAFREHPELNRPRHQHVPDARLSRIPW
ncbi:hypothetical protein EBZ37_02295 [bacterium]|nr:hypothetical protein [bacterium]